MKALIQGRYWILCLVLGLVLFSLLHWLDHNAIETGAAKRVLPVATLLDDQTPWLWHVPKVNEAFDSVKASDLGRLWQTSALPQTVIEPFAGLPEMETLAAFSEAWLALDARDLGVALREGQDGLEILVIFRSSRDVSAVWDRCRSWFSEKWQSDENASHWEDAVHYQFIGTAPQQLVQARWEDWIITGTKPAWVRRVVSHLLADHPPTASLGHCQTFQKALSTLPRDYVSLVYGRPKQQEPPQTEPPTFLSALPVATRLQELQKAVTGAGLDGFAVTSSIRRGRLIDQAILLGPKPADLSDSEISLPIDLTSPETVTFFAGKMGGGEIRRQIMGPVMEHWKAEGIATAPLAAGFGNTWSLQLEPVTHAESERTELAVIASFQLQNPSACARWIQQLAQDPRAAVTQSAVETYTIDGNQFPEPVPSLLPEINVRVHGDLLLLADDAQGLHQVARRRELGNHLNDRADYRRMIRQMPRPEWGLGFIDSEQLLDHSYRALQHPLILATLWMGIRSQTDLEFDLARLPRTADLEVEIIPTVISMNPSDQGWKMFSMGSIGPIQWLGGGRALAAFMDKTLLEPVPTALEDQFTAPALEQELMDMIDDGENQSSKN